ncbi:MAG: DUF815 domain-containing protein [Lachnospiraceae bacterium]|nr:DUF815 domain-containing protein [Lachnospiraceae bacterium]
MDGDDFEDEAAEDATEEDWDEEDDEELYQDLVGETVHLFSEIQRLSRAVSRGLIRVAGAHGFSGNIWRSYIALVLAEDENAFSLACEVRGLTGSGADQMALNDFAVLKRLFDLELREIHPALYRGLSAEAEDVDLLSILASYPAGTGQSKIYNTRIRDSIQKLALDLEGAETEEDWLHLVGDFYRNFGVGMFGLHKAFRIEGEGDTCRIVPITKTQHVLLSDLVGYESQKKRLTDNTEAFVEGKRANNVLLYGDSGTGKSTSIKAIINQYYDRGLRVIEIYKHQFRDLSRIISLIKNRNYKFLIYMDDLSFEDFEIEYKYLKAIIEGGLERRPENVLIYATSNRRHLIREQYGDKEEIREDMHTSDTVQEKMSLVARFGVTIYYGRPGKTEFQDIVVHLAEKVGVTMPENELLAEANKWELAHGGMSGRTAAQFITYLKGMQDLGRR